MGQGPLVSPGTWEWVLKLTACFKVLRPENCVSMGFFLQNRLSGLPAQPFRIQPGKFLGWAGIRLADGLLWVETPHSADFATLVKGEAVSVVEYINGC